MKNFDQLRNILNNQKNHYLEEAKQASVLLLLVKINGEHHIVFQERHPDIWQGGEISFPGGGIDKTDKNPIETAYRETYEEMNIPSEKIKIAGHLKTLMSPMGFIVHCYVGIYLGEWTLPDFNEEEVSNVFLTPVSFFMKNKAKEYSVVTSTFSYEKNSDNERVLLPAKELNLPEIYYERWGDVKSKVYFFFYNNYTIWGLTARFVIEFLSLMEKEELNILDN